MANNSYFRFDNVDTVKYKPFAQSLSIRLICPIYLIIEINQIVWTIKQEGEE